MRYEITVNLTPVPASRPRHSRFGGIHYSKSHHQYQDDLYKTGIECNIDVPDSPHTEHFSINTTYVIPLPKNTSKKRKLELDGSFCDKKIDLDNLDKLFWDEVITGTFLEDDNQIVMGSNKKIWTSEPVGYTFCILEKIDYN